MARRRGPATVRSVPAALGPAVGRALVRWFRAHRRPLPWRRRRDAYGLWVAEVLLQQTRVDQAVPYYARFLARFPTVRALASAPIGEVLKEWQGAGYYARARHLHAAARSVVAARGGRLPREVPELEALPGIGPYTARAIASQAYGAPVVALEANGIRVASRLTRERGDVRRAPVRARLERALATALPPAAAGAFNEAVMELGETVCRPTDPRCPDCPIAFACRAFRETRDPGAIPRRVRREPRPRVRGAVVVVSERGRWLVQQRPPTGLLGGLWEFPGGKIRAGERPEAAARRELREETGLAVGTLRPRGVVRHAYSHFTVELHVFEGRARAGTRARTGATRRWVRPDELRVLPIPKATEKIARLVGPAGTASPG